MLPTKEEDLQQTSVYFYDPHRYNYKQMNVLALSLLAFCAYAIITQYLLLCCDDRIGTPTKAYIKFWGAHLNRNHSKNIVNNLGGNSSSLKGAYDDDDGNKTQNLTSTVLLLPLNTTTLARFSLAENKTDEIFIELF